MLGEVTVDRTTTKYDSTGPNRACGIANLFEYELEVVATGPKSPAN